MRPLYAIAYELYRKGQIQKAGIEYVHADSTAHARNQYCFQYPNRRTHKIIGVAPVVGYHVDDNHGELLHV